MKTTEIRGQLRHFIKQGSIDHAIGTTIEVGEQPVYVSNGDGHRPFDIIVTLHPSRFFRDATGARVWKRKLSKAGVKVVSMHLQVADDPMGKVVEGIFELIDEYESNINGFHTLRAMKENARKGYYNGSRPKFGFKVVRDNG